VGGGNQAVSERWTHDPAVLLATLKTDRQLVAPRRLNSKLNSAHKRRIRDLLLELHGPFCWLCNEEIASDELTLDHIVPHSRGGRNAIANVRLAHRSCNQVRGNGPVPELLLTKRMERR
jgi:5-methylcytosine-specific restriction endonuclease McrA